jgi:hypothetical protein
MQSPRFRLPCATRSLKQGASSRWNSRTLLVTSNEQGRSLRAPCCPCALRMRAMPAMMSCARVAWTCRFPRQTSRDRIVELAAQPGGIVVNGSSHVGRFRNPLRDRSLRRGALVPIPVRVPFERGRADLAILHPQRSVEGAYPVNVVSRVILASWSIPLRAAVIDASPSVGTVCTTLRGSRRRRAGSCRRFPLARPTRQA